MQRNPSDVFVVGIGRTRFNRDPNSCIRGMTESSIKSALNDAGASLKDIEGVWFGNAGQGALEGQHMIRGQLAVRGMGLERVPIVNLENACASATTALQAAVTAVRAGDTEVALAIGAERLAIGNSQASGDFFLGAMCVREGPAHAAALTSRVTPDDADTARRSIFMDVYAALARNHMDRFGSTQEQLAAVTSKNRSHAHLNPLAQYREKMSPEMVLAQRSIVWPFTLPMCSPISNGAAAALVCSGSALDRFTQSRPVRIAAIAMGSGSDRSLDQYDKHLVRRLAGQAYEMSSYGPEDIDLAEVHDATAAGEVIQSECLGLVPDGEGGAAAQRGDTSLGGRIPINLSGGLECNGHPVGATGLAQVHEIVTQLRGTAGARQVTRPRVGIVENGGGFIGAEEAAAVVAIFDTKGLH